ncbi:MAG: CvpA family protein [Hydrogenothermaceae bacterium]|nr:CvpA family protein [Hydrogenothermaceae bacterium]
MDLILTVLFVYLLLQGVYRGFLGLFLNVAGFLLGLYISIPIYKTFSNFLSKFFSGSFFFLDFLAFFLIFVFVISTFIIVEKLLKLKIYKKRKIVITDKFMGASLGIVSFLLILFFLIKIESSSPLAEKLISQSKIISIFKNFI